MRKLGLPISVLPVGLLLLLAVVSPASAQPGSVSVPLGAGRDEQNVNGSATLTDLGDGTTQVVIRVNPANPVMLAHIHVDTCPGAGAVQYPLTNVQNGTSTTVVDASLSDVLANGKSINLHKSPDDAGIYVSCGNFTAAAQAGGGAAQVPRALPRTGDLGSLAPVLGALGAGLAGAGYLLRRRFSR
jgi:LPXTG-motif cell wall-anchored protein